MKKTITITVTPGPNTRWLVSDETFAANVRCVAGSLMHCNTTGEVPKVEVQIANTPKAEGK